MKITDYTLYQVPPRWLFLKIETDEGFVGWGEPIIEGRALTVKAAVEELMEYLIGKDPQRIEDHWNLLYRSGFYRGGPILMSAIAGIDQALWDIKGKYYNAPIYQLLGGKCRDKIKVYSWIGGDRPSEVVTAAKEVVDQGFTALKMNATEELQYIDSHQKMDQVIERISAVRDAVGSSIGIGIDFHGRVHKPMAKILAKELEPFHPMFIEEPVLPENNEALREIANHVTIPIAVGERMFSRWQFKPLLKDGYVDIIQPDLSHAGGITECKKIISMAEAFDVAAAPHCPLGPIALAACLQVDATSHNAFIQEQSLGIHYNVESDLLDYVVDKDVFKYENGYVYISNKPGLGIEIDEEHVKRMATKSVNCRNPVWRHEDGSIAEW
ncbi:galactonate dehydratase [Virgibacillus pantothenticus]|uniref:galactonate dehydratase n=1 Tax=Virgibacillus pantothenticus TaxID=1473 RepID=UPI001C213B86|nr:galactonate dehydratase [Virgibacillus pantothenticus]MBU8567187.1 galactonate dehydratase [Virgibacillus pantothenticus]MBU8600783.1 galactonate dehydratase [Virgibacillus pantothenticus]MBU8635337.1 galactonate dehydratase [Virgibacillus pantothenticus]MBU8643039.1 galactonate dehydratase [Virgibacillus pantothenticus]MBU8646941.1 galactonate dehydratase [Virgibacillus pantothenticus]